MTFIMNNNSPLYGYRKTPKIPTNTEFMAMSDEDIIAYWTDKEDNWKKVPRERIDDRLKCRFCRSKNE